jgi:hypothetical protein
MVSKIHVIHDESSCNIIVISQVISHSTKFVCGQSVKQKKNIQGKKYAMMIEFNYTYIPISSYQSNCNCYQIRTFIYSCRNMLVRKRLQMHTCVDKKMLIPVLSLVCIFILICKYGCTYICIKICVNISIYKLLYTYI